MKIQHLILFLVSMTLVSQAADSVSPYTLPTASATEGSIYDLASNWYSQDGHAVNLEDLNGKVRVVAMGYTSCQYACPRIIADLKRVETALSDNERSSGKISFSFISIDPETDTPELMKELEKNYGMDSELWLLLTGDEDGVLELAVALGMKYRKTSPMDFAHSNIITILAPDGTIFYQTSSIGEEIDQTLKAVRTSLSSMK